MDCLAVIPLRDYLSENSIGWVLASTWNCVSKIQYWPLATQNDCRFVNSLVFMAELTSPNLPFLNRCDCVAFTRPKVGLE